jgi:hypothetical protein
MVKKNNKTNKQTKTANADRSGKTKRGPWYKSNSSSCEESILSFLSIQGQPAARGQHLKGAFSPGTAQRS